MAVVPGPFASLRTGTLICTQFKSCTVTVFWLRDKLYRDTAPVSANNYVTGDKFAAPIKLVPRQPYNPQDLYPDGKKCAIPSFGRRSFSEGEPCTVTAFRLKYRDSARCLRRVTQPPHNAGPLAVTNH